MTIESLLKLFIAAIGGAGTTLGAVWWLLGPRIDRYTDQRIDAKLGPVRDQLNRHEAVFVPLPMTMDALKTSIGELASAVKEMTERHQDEALANGVMRERVNILFEERRSGVDRRRSPTRGRD